jgi:5-methylcytosine-specific restriction enzyme A
MTRSTPEWIGATPDTAIPQRVRLRVFARHNGICHISGRKIAAGEPWDCDHVIALINGGENRETNLAPALRDKHQAKTAEDVAEKSRRARKQAFHLGAKQRGRGFPPAQRKGGASRPLTKPLPPRRNPFQGWSA